MKSAKIVSLITVTYALAAFSVRADDATNAPAADAPATAPATGSTSADSLKPAMDEDAWQFGLSVPLWAPQINGNVTILGHQENVNVNFSELKDHLDTSLSLAVDARKGKFDFFGNVGYMKFSVSSSHVGPDGHVHVNSWAGLKFLVSNMEGGYILVKTESEHPFILEGTAGIRYWYASMPITLSDNLGNTLFAGSKTWNIVDPILGLKASQYFTSKFHLDICGDGGGFNLNNDTDWTWSAAGVLTYDFCKYISLSAGYQAMALDESNGSGVGKGGKNSANLVFQGALVTLGFHF